MFEVVRVLKDIFPVVKVTGLVVDLSKGILFQL